MWGAQPAPTPSPLSATSLQGTARGRRDSITPALVVFSVSLPHSRLSLRTIGDARICSPQTLFLGPVDQTSLAMSPLGSMEEVSV